MTVWPPHSDLHAWTGGGLNLKQAAHDWTCGNHTQVEMHLHARIRLKRGERGGGMQVNLPDSTRQGPPSLCGTPWPPALPSPGCGQQL
eukprot:2744465-Pyramimonas_sp.AAC.1